MIVSRWRFDTVAPLRCRAAITDLSETIQEQIEERNAEAVAARSRHRLRITGLPADWDDDILREEFEGWEVTECKVVGNGVGFVTFEHKEEMEEAIADLDGEMIDGSILRAMDAGNQQRPQQGVRATIFAIAFFPECVSKKYDRCVTGRLGRGRRRWLRSRP